jgi:DNA-binding GntR family transcriptional regulator
MLQASADRAGDRATAARPSLRDTVYYLLRRRITDLAATAAAPIVLREADLARSLGVSRTPVREALSRLVEEGVLTISPRRGVQVVPTSLDEYVAWLEVREVLEGLAARLAAERATARAVKQMREIFRPFGLDTVGEGSSEYARANARFHALVAQEAGNPVLLRLARHYDRMEMARLRVIERLGRGRQSLREHLRLIDAIARRDAVAAETLGQAHVRSLRRAVERHLRQLRPPGERELAAAARNGRRR